MSVESTQDVVLELATARNLLVQKKQDVDREIDEVNKKLTAALSATLNGTAGLVPGSKPAVSRRQTEDEAPRRGRKPRQQRTEEDGRVSLKDVVRKVLTQGPAALKDIVAEVTEMIKRGEYKSNTKSVTAVVSQALNQLKTNEEIDKDSESRKYRLKK